MSKKSTSVVKLQLPKSRPVGGGTSIVHTFPGNTEASKK